MSPDLSGAVLRIDARDIDADAVALDRLARLALAAHRCGYRVVVIRASPDLTGLIELAGLSQALGVDPLRPDSTPPKC